MLQSVTEAALVHPDSRRGSEPQALIGGAPRNFEVTL